MDILLLCKRHLIKSEKISTNIWNKAYILVLRYIVLLAGFA